MHRTLPLKNRQSDITPLELIEEIKQNIPKIEEDLVGNLMWYSPNARYVPNTLNVISLEELGQSRYKMNYSFLWNVFNACLDIDSDETSNNSVNFVLADGALVFDFIDNEQDSMSEEL
ncbi:hypothetical protein [Erwinia sp. JUb26]|uniref:hypothetical protein n=1 Tax=Erwinia sp. JUb26 TaxID=2485126 RepID=UPI000F47F168|nr:hypothetical protein [Erwinia sp. JUb26]ROR06895.1 hypothetical protein EC836_107179 [Erwinia sp. JUb26]